MTCNVNPIKLIGRCGRLMCVEFLGQLNCFRKKVVEVAKKAGTSAAMAGQSLVGGYCVGVISKIHISIHDSDPMSETRNAGADFI